MKSGATLLLILVCHVLNGSEYSHRIWRTEDGLPQNRVQALAQTKEGYLWIGTSEGLARFDGVRFFTFDRTNTPAISDNSILCLESEADGSLWVGTEGGGLLHYANGAFEAFGQKEGLTNNFIRAIHLDRHSSLWVGSDRGFFRYANRRFERLDGTPEVPLASVMEIAEDGGGKIWAATAGGLTTVEGGKLKKIVCDHSTGISASLTVLLIREGLSTGGCGVAQVSLPAISITSLHKDRKGNLWAGTVGRGLISLDLRTGAKTEYTAPSVLPIDSVFVLFEDQQHSIWAGAQDGLVQFSEAVVSTVSRSDGLLDEDVSTTYEDRQGKLWIITYSGQIYYLDGDRPVRYPMPEDFREMRFRSVFMDRHEDYWFGTAGSGVVRISGRQAVNFSKKNGLRSNSIRDIFEDSRGTIWLATGSGLTNWDGKKFQNIYLEEGLSYPSARCLGEAANGDILAGTDMGLNRIHNGKAVKDPAFALLAKEKVWSLLVDGNSIWLGTRGGGLVLVRDGKANRFTTSDGLANDSIYQIVDDRAGRLWLSGPNGISAVRRSELDALASGAKAGLHAVVFGSSDGMSTSQMYGGVQPAGCRRASGEIWFPSVRGAVRVNPSRLPERASGPALVEGLWVAGKPIPVSREVDLPARPGRLQIDFTACDLVAPQQLSFRYKMEGFDDSWNTATHTRSAFYSNLPAGHYRFRVIAENTGAAGASTTEASLAIYRKPAFQETGWFYGMLVVLLSGLGWGGFWIYSRQSKMRFALLLNERTRLAREMHDTVIQGCIGVSTLLEAAARRLKTDPTGAGNLLTDARSQIRDTVEEARQAVWDLRQPNHTHSPVLALFDLARKLGGEHGAQVATAISGTERRLDPSTEHTLLLVGREALRNSVSHGNPTSISVRIAYEETEARMEVRDDGTGFDYDALNSSPEGHFGIVGMRERVEQAGGSFTLRSQPGQGTTVVACFPNAKA